MKTMMKYAVASLTLVAAPLCQAQGLSAAQQELAAENFMQADANQDGALTRGEFQTLINLNADDSLGRASMIKRFGRYDTAFNRIDANQDGFVTPEEMQAMAAKAGG